MWKYKNITTKTIKKKRNQLDDELTVINSRLKEFNNLK